jgi:hypothetical protein
LDVEVGGGVEAAGLGGEEAGVDCVGLEGEFQSDLF